MTLLSSASEMKDSGIEWLGQIPTNWVVPKILYVLRGKITDGPHETPDYIDVGIPFISIDSLNETKKIDFSVCKRFISEEEYLRFATKTVLEEGDILFSKAASIGKTAIVGKEKFMVWSPLAILKNEPNKVTNGFLYYLLNCSELITAIALSGSMNTQINVGMRELEQARIPLPMSLSEQQAIADYLDDRCSKIDEIIAEATASIEEYKELKQAVITEAVTKGLNNKPTVYSGDPNIGDVSEGWRVCKTLYGLDMPITDGPHTTPELYDDGVPFISAEAVSCGQGSIDFDHMRGYISEEFYQECCKKYVPAIDDIYMIKSGATTGRVSMVETDRKFTIWSPLAVFRVNRDRLIPRFLFYFLQSKPYQQQVQLGWTFGTQQNIGMRTLEKLKICMPPLDEQSEIVEYLDVRIGDMDALISEKQALIDDLQAYKKSLIYEVVTGKRRVV